MTRKEDFMKSDFYKQVVSVAKEYDMWRRKSHYETSTNTTTLHRERLNAYEQAIEFILGEVYIFVGTDKGYGLGNVGDVDDWLFFNKYN